MSFITRTPVLWALFVLTIALTVAFGAAAPAVATAARLKNLRRVP